MIVVCPKCFTRFNLPPEAEHPKARLRCSVCKQVFTLDADKDAFASLTEPLGFSEPAASKGAGKDAQSDSASKPAAVKKTPPRKRYVWAILLLLFAVGICFFYKPFFMGMLGSGTPVAEDSVSRIALKDVRHRFVRASSGENRLIVEGMVVNGFASPRELIRVEVNLYGGAGEKLASKEQIAGTTATTLQVQILSEKELDAVLNGNNTAVKISTGAAPQAEMPFMVVFHNPPASSKCNINAKVIGARIPPNHDAQ